MPVRQPLVLLAALLPVLAVSGVANAKVSVERTKFSGKQAAATFSVEEDIKCANGSAGHVSATGFLQGSEQMSRETGSPKTFSNGVFVGIDSFSNSCTGASFFALAGGFADGFTPPNFWLGSAGIAGATTVQDFGTGETFPVSLDVVFEADGPLTLTRDSSKTRNLNGKGRLVSLTFARSVATNRSAVASGTITIAGVELSPVFAFATLTGNSNSQLEIQR